MTASGKFISSFTSVYDNKMTDFVLLSNQMTDFVELLTIALPFHPQWFD